MSDVQILDPEGGTNQSGLRDQNARLVLSYIRRHGALPSAEIARRSGLSAQTVSNITRALETEGLLRRGEAIKGKVGKPSVPVALNPDGVNSFGLSIGRRSSELVLVDFNGKPIETLTTSYAYPVIEDVFDFLSSGIDRICAAHPKARTRATGVGVARPGKLWNWLEVVNAPEEVMQKWRDLDIQAEVKERTGLNAIIENDATSACVAEHLLGRGSEFSNFIYVFLGSFIGGGLVLNGKVVPGQTGNAAALGPLPVPDGAGGTTQLLNVASLHVLETALRDAGIDPKFLRSDSDDWSAHAAYVDPWIETTSRYLALAAVAITSVVEVDAILIDGAMPKGIRQRLSVTTQRKFDALDLTVIDRPRIKEAAVGRGARSLGAALLPIHDLYFLA